MIKKFISDIKRLTPTKYNRILLYINNLDENIKIDNEKDEKIVDEIKKISHSIIKKLKKYHSLNIFFYFAIYFSVLSTYLSGFIFLADITNIISKTIGVLGTTLFMIAVYFSNKIIDLYYQDLNLITAHLISIYSKYQRNIFNELNKEESNYYEVFIEFFKKRGY